LEKLPSSPECVSSRKECTRGGLKGKRGKTCCYQSATVACNVTHHLRAAAAAPDAVQMSEVLLLLQNVRIIISSSSRLPTTFFTRCRTILSRWSLQQQLSHHGSIPHTIISNHFPFDPHWSLEALRTHGSLEALRTHWSLGAVPPNWSHFALETCVLLASCNWVVVTQPFLHSSRLWPLEHHGRPCRGSRVLLCFHYNQRHRDVLRPHPSR
jgi:hypothetical protein